VCLATDNIPGQRHPARLDRYDLTTRASQEMDVNSRHTRRRDLGGSPIRRLWEIACFFSQHRVGLVHDGQLLNGVDI